MLFKRDEAPTPTFPVAKTEAEWRAALSPEAFRVLRQHGTERPGTSPLNAEKRAGTFACAGCGQALFDAATKFEAARAGLRSSRRSKARSANRRTGPSS